jgi:hypothetical protein
MPRQSNPVQHNSLPAPSHGPRAWVGVVSRAHVLRGVQGGFAQLCHGRHAPLDRMQLGDWLVYYSPTTEFRSGTALRAFTAVGRVVGERSYPFDMGGGFVPYRRTVAYERSDAPVPAKALAAQLHFMCSGSNWGMRARRGHFEIDLHDLELIASALRAA